MSRVNHGLSMYLAYKCVYGNKMRKTNRQVNLPPMIYHPYFYGKFTPTEAFPTEEDYFRYKENPEKYIKEMNEKWMKKTNNSQINNGLMWFAISMFIFFMLCIIFMSC